MTRPEEFTQIGLEFGVHCTLEDTVRKASARVRINARVVDPRRAVHAWAERHERKLDGVFTPEDELALVGAIEPSLRRR